MTQPDPVPTDTPPPPPPICGHTWIEYGLIEGTLLWGDTEHLCGGPPAHDTQHLCGCASRDQLELVLPPPPMCPEA